MRRRGVGGATPERTLGSVRQAFGICGDVGAEPERRNGSFSACAEPSLYARSGQSSARLSCVLITLVHEAFRRG